MMQTSGNAHGSLYHFMVIFSFHISTLRLMPPSDVAGLTCMTQIVQSIIVIPNHGYVCRVLFLDGVLLMLTKRDTPHERRVVTLSEAAAILRISRGSAYEAAKRKEIPTIRIGRLLRVPVASLARLLAGDSAA
jgi:excisionase family DNA binding protein